MTSSLPTLPSEWEWKKLPDIIRIGCQRGFTPSLIDGKVPFIGMSDIDDLKGRNSKYILEDYAKVSSGKTKFEKNAVLVGKITPCTQNNKISIVPDDIEGGFATTEVFALHCSDEILPIYLNYYLRSNKINKILVNSMIGATGRQRVPTETLTNLPIPLPPLEEQKRLVSLLDTLFAKIDRSIELLEENITAADALLPSALNTVFGELEEKWESKLLENLIKISSGNYFNANEYSDEGVRLFKINNVTFGSTSWENIDYLPLEYIEKHPELVLKNKDLVMALNRPLLNRKLKITFIKETDSPSILYQRVGKIIPKDQNTLLKEYIFWCFNSPIFIDEFEGKLLGSDQPYINNKNLYSIKIPFPPLDIQTQSVAYLDSIRAKVETLKHVQNNKIANLKALKASILDRAFKGEL